MADAPQSFHLPLRAYEDAISPLKTIPHISREEYGGPTEVSKCVVAPPAASPGESNCICDNFTVSVSITDVCFAEAAALATNGSTSPFPVVDWVIPKLLLAGGFPGSPDDRQNEANFRRLLAAGVRTFVCLQKEYNSEATDADRRAGAMFGPYMHHAARSLVEVEGASADAASLQFVHFPIQDAATGCDGEVLRFARDLCDRMRRGEVLYVHCWGGHGRTGTVVAILLGLLYDMTHAQALEYVQACHFQRLAQPWHPSPETASQRQQVARVIEAGKPKDRD